VIQRDTFKPQALPIIEWEILDGLRRGVSHRDLVLQYQEHFAYNLRKVYRDLANSFGFSTVTELVDFVTSNGMPSKLQ